MKVRFLSEDALDYLKVNLPILANYFKDPSNKDLIAALKQGIGNSSVLVETDYILPETSLVNDNKFAGELNNVRTVYSGLSIIPVTKAMDERLWAGLAIDAYWSYVQTRWDIVNILDDDKEKGVKAIKEHYLYAHNPRRSFTRNAIARLWWLGHLTYDNAAKDKFWMTSIVMQDLGYVVDLLERNFSNNSSISSTFIKAVEEARQAVLPEGKTIKRPELRILCKYLNMLGGVYVLDAMPTDVIYNKIKSKAISVARVRLGSDPDDEVGDDLADEDDE